MDKANRLGPDREAGSRGEAPWDRNLQKSGPEMVIFTRTFD